ncbi:MAG: capsule assembly Wzi family protein, partial [Pseudolabrys sp.]
EYMSHSTAIRLSAGALIDKFSGGKTQFMPDGSYIAQNIGGSVVYAGYLTHWWGPGWISALSLSNNARPFPQVGIARLGTSPFDSSLLNWIGPWQAEFFAGWLDDSRIATNTLYSGLRFTFNPLPGLQIGLARTEMFCGKGHPCKPLAGYFHFANQNNNVNYTNDEGVIDVRYSTQIGHLPFEIYTQELNEDSNPLVHSGTSHLFGASTWIPFGHNTARFTVEYTDSIATRDIFSFGDVFHGFAYNNYSYVDGMRYRGRTIGFSLDSDSRLLSVQTSWVDSGDRTYTLTFHHADISDAQNVPNPMGTFGNVVTTAPVTINIGEARLSVPMRSMTLDLAARIQDDQPRPEHGYTGAFEARLTVDL